MQEAISSHQMQKSIECELMKQPHIGFRKAVMNIVFEGRSSFDPQTRRQPRIGFVLGAVFFAVAVICFCYFNFGG